MNKNHKFNILGLIFVVLVGVFIVFFSTKIHKEVAGKKILKSFQSIMKPIDINEMNIVLFTIDTLRADHLECYGYDRVKTPHINRLAKEGILFEYTIATAPLTLPSHASIFTGAYPLFHGIRDNGGYYLEKNHVTLAEVLKKRGYSTAAFVAAFVLDSRWGLDQGFDYYYDNFDLTKYKTISLDSVQRRGDEVLSEAYKWLEGNSQEKFFAWIHIYDPHTPYDPPEPYKTQYSDGYYGLYDGEIAYVDQLMGEFQTFLNENKLNDNTLIIFTADHGESLGEHKESAHGFFIYDSAVRVPLIFRIPGLQFQGKTIPEQVSSIDIMPTILNILDEEYPVNVQGESFLPLIMGEKERYQRTAYSETYWPNLHYGWSELKSIRKGRYKFIDAPQPELYDILADPGEVSNLVDSKASLGHEMKRELMTLIDRFYAEGVEEERPKKLDNDSLIKLQALGYIGSFHSSLERKQGRLADPKDKIELYNEIKLAQFLAAEKKTDQAVVKLRNILNKDPSVLECYYILGNVYFQQEQYDEASEEFKKALAIHPEYYEAIFGLALVYKRTKDYDKAIVGFKRLIDMDPKDTKPFLHMGDIYDEKGQFDETEKYLKSASLLDPESPVFHNKLGAVYFKQKKFAEAEKEIKAALNIKRSIPLINAHFNMALLHEARGEFDLAVLEYKKEQESCPFNYKPDFNLGLLYADAEELDKAIKEFRSCINKDPEYANVYIFLAKAYMDGGKDLEEAVKLALKGLELKPDLRNAVLAHYILADIYNRVGRLRESNQHVNKARELQKKLSH